MYSVLCTLCTLYSVLCTLCTLYSVHCVLCTLYTVYSVLCTLYTVYSVLCVLCILLTTDLLTTALTFVLAGAVQGPPPLLCYKGEQQLPLQPAGFGYMHTELL